jgi:hypothetical protein
MAIGSQNIIGGIEASPAVAGNERLTPGIGSAAAMQYAPDYSGYSR